jgi:hypothetical protein
LLIALLVSLCAGPASASPTLSILRSLSTRSLHGPLDRGLDRLARLAERLLAPPPAGSVRPWVDYSLSVSQAQYLPAPPDGARRIEFALGPMVTLGLEGRF